MKAEYVYKMAVEALRTVCFQNCEETEEAEKLFRNVIKDPFSFTNLPPYGELGELAWKARDEIANAVAKGSGKSGLLRAMKSIIKSASSTNRSLIFGAWNDADGRQIVCDGYRLIRATVPLEGLPEVEGMDVSKIVSGAQDTCKREMKLPKLGDVKAHIALQKAVNPGKYTGKHARPVLYDFGDDLPMVDASFLLDMLLAFPDADVCYISEKPLVSPIYFTGEAGDGVLLPVRKIKEEE